jgi:hypothetical protein
MRRVFGLDVLVCPRCGHAMRLIAVMEQPDVIRRILRHLGEPTDVPAPAPARAPPHARDCDDDTARWHAEFDVVGRRFVEPVIDDPC